jgi:hypothetical protein
MPVTRYANIHYIAKYAKYFDTDWILHYAAERTFFWCDGDGDLCRFQNKQIIALLHTKMSSYPMYKTFSVYELWQYCSYTFLPSSCIRTILIILFLVQAFSELDRLRPHIAKHSSGALSPPVIKREPEDNNNEESNDSINTGPGNTNILFCLL